MGSFMFCQFSVLLPVLLRDIVGDHFRAFNSKTSFFFFTLVGLQYQLHLITISTVILREPLSRHTTIARLLVSTAYSVERYEEYHAENAEKFRTGECRVENCREDTSVA